MCMQAVWVWPRWQNPQSSKERGDGHTHTPQPSMPATLQMHGLVGWLPSPRRTGSPRPHVRLSELSPDQFQKTLTLKEEDLPHYARSTLHRRQLPSKQEVDLWQAQDKTPPRPVPPSSRAPTVPTVASAKASSGKQTGSSTPTSSSTHASSRRRSATQQQQHQHPRRHQLPFHPESELPPPPPPADWRAVLRERQKRKDVAF